MIPALILAAQLQATPAPPVAPAGFKVYTSTLTAFDPSMAFAYQRTVYIIVGPPEQVQGYPAPPELETRAILTDVHLVATPAGRACDPEAPTYLEVGGGLIRACQGDTQEP